MTRITKLKIGNKAFTLLELLLVIAIIAVLAGIIMFALKPSDRLQQANQVKVLSNANDIERAFNSYVVDNGGSLPTAFNSLTYGYYDMCKTTAVGCISLIDLIPKYIQSLPIDSAYSTIDTTGFKVKYDPIKKEVIVSTYAEYRQWAEANGATLNEGLVGYWRMDEVGWNGTVGEVKDSSSSANHGVSSGGLTTTVSKFGNGGNFDGVNDYVTVNHSDTLDSLEFTLSTWVMRTGTGVGSNQFFILKNAMYGFDWTGTVLKYYDNSYHNANSVLPLNTWVHLTMVHKSNMVYLYVNGVLDSSDSIAGSPNLNYNGIVEFGRLGGDYFSGTIDELRIYNRALSSVEAKALYDLAPSPIAHWKFDETSGTTATDSSGNGNNGNVVNGPTWVTGKYGNALSFDGIDDHVIKNSFSMFPTNNVTTTFWIKTIDSGDGIISYASASIDNDWLIYDSSGLQIYRSAAVGTGIPVNDNNWNHVAISRDVLTGSTKFYKNGVVVFTGILSPGGTIVPNGALVIGQEQDAMGGGFAVVQAFGGLIDDIRIYNYVRTPEQIIKDMNNL